MSKRHTPPDALSPSLARVLAEDPAPWTLRLLRARMPMALRQEAVQAVLEDDDDAPPLLSVLIAALAGSWSASTPTPSSRSSTPGSTRPAI